MLEFSIFIIKLKQVEVLPLLQTLKCRNKKMQTSISTFQIKWLKMGRF